MAVKICLVCVVGIVMPRIVLSAHILCALRWLVAWFDSMSSSLLTSRWWKDAFVIVNVLPLEDFLHVKVFPWGSFVADVTTDAEMI